MAEFIISKGDVEEKTHMFGNPVVCDDFEWPTISRSYNDSEMMFICQIECSKIGSDLLPQEGILYFFYDAVNQPATPNIKDAARVIWYNGDGELAAVRLVDENGQDLCLPQRGLIPVESGDVAVMLEDEEDDDAYYDEEYLQDEDSEFGEDEYSVILARFNCYEDEEIAFKFEKGEQLYFLMKKEDLSERNFSDVRVMIV